ncbi:TonB-dependent receptor [Sphingobacterium arenae]|uniref:TonB-dependent receptor n=1 Tax=Sphingobacterium arenae TaxID=1280598 RepID=UPI00293BF060|nr:TonB-dependent receptor [Sphingobacterium arenae]
MKKSTLINLILHYCLLLFLPASLHAQQDFRVRGFVVDAGTGNPLPGASVQIESTPLEVTTDLNGQFVFGRVQGRTIRLKISYMGYQEERVVLTPERIANGIRISLQPMANTIDEVLVSANLEGQQKALNQQRNADNIKNIISADVIGRFPDLNVAEALQRVPGINIQRDKGEGATISLRGTPAHFTTVQINGEQLPSVQQSGSRNEALDLIPADQLASIEIIKAPTPDLDGDAVGGIVNLRTPTANKLRWTGKAEGAMGYNDISGGLNGIGKLRVDRRFLATDKVPEGKIGVMLSGSYFSSNNSEDRLDAVWRETEILGQEGTWNLPQNYGFRKTENERKRTGVTATFDYKPNGFNHLVFNYMFNQRIDHDVQNRQRYDFDRSGTEWISFNEAAGARVRRDINLWDEDKTNHNFSVQGYHTIRSWQLDWAGSYTRSSREFASTRGDFSYDDIDLRVAGENDIYSAYPVFEATQPQLDLYNPLLYNDFRRYEEDAENTTADNLVLRADLTKQTWLWGFPLSVKVGGKYRTQSNSKLRNNQVLAFWDPNEVLNLNEAFTRVIGNKEPANFLFRDYRFGPLINEEKFTGYIHDNRYLLTQGSDAWDAERLSLNDTYDAYEDIYAGYAMGRWQMDKLMVLAGLRLESNSVRYDAFDVFRTGTVVESSPISGGRDYVFFLPHLHLKYGLDEWSNLRFSVLRNYARPNFVDVVPYVNYDVDALRLQLGNPGLQPSTAWNVDAMFERYFPNTGLLSVGVFYKNMDRFQFTSIINSLPEPFPGYPETQGFEFRQVQNGKQATVAGAEVNLSRSLDFLPGIAKGLSVNANYTFASSNAYTQDRSDIRLPGQAAHTFNTMLAFDYKRFTIRGSVNYNGSYANSIASDAAGDIIQRHRTQLDMNASYSWKNFRLFTEWINLLNEPSIRYQGTSDYVSRIAYFGYSARAGIGYVIR